MRPGNNWWHHIHNGEAERDTCCHSTPYLLYTGSHLGNGTTHNPQWAGLATSINITKIITYNHTQRPILCCQVDNTNHHRKTWFLTHIWNLVWCWAWMRGRQTADPARVAAETPSFSSPSRTENLLVGFWPLISLYPPHPPYPKVIFQMFDSDHMFSKQKRFGVFRKSIYILQYKTRSKEKNYVIIF